VKLKTLFQIRVPSVTLSSHLALGSKLSKTTTELEIFRLLGLLMTGLLSLLFVVITSTPCVHKAILVKKIP
jgi:hypothetical protein